MTLSEKYSVRLEVCQFDIDDTVKDLHKMCNRVYDIQLRGSMTKASESMLWVEDLAVAAAECKKLRAKLMQLQDHKTFLFKLLMDLETV